MRTATLLLACLAAGSVRGGELGILVDKQYGKSQAALAFSTQKYDAVSPSGSAFRAGVEVLDLRLASLQFNTTWHTKSTTDLAYGGNRLGTFASQYWAVGATVNWKLLVNFGAGVEYRSEKLSFRPAAGPGADTTLGRPWAKVNFGFSAPLPALSPFVLLEVAAPVRPTRDTTTTSPRDLTEALAPQLQVGLYGGIRF